MARNARAAQILKVAKPALLRWLARTTGITLTWFWGVGGLPIPFPRKITVAVGKPLGLPKLERPTDEDVAKWHALYVSEVQRIFDTYKGTNPVRAPSVRCHALEGGGGRRPVLRTQRWRRRAQDYINKQLIFEG